MTDRLPKDSCKKVVRTFRLICDPPRPKGPSNNDSKFPFLKLPGEIRNMIYEYFVGTIACHSGRVIMLKHVYLSRPVFFDQRLQNPLHVVRRWPFVILMFVNKQIGMQVKSMFYSRATFFLDHPYALNYIKHFPLQNLRIGLGIGLSRRDPRPLQKQIFEEMEDDMLGVAKLLSHPTLKNLFREKNLTPRDRPASDPSLIVEKYTKFKEVFESQVERTSWHSLTTFPRRTGDTPFELKVDIGARESGPVLILSWKRTELLEGESSQPEFFLPTPKVLTL